MTLAAAAAAEAMGAEDSTPSFASLILILAVIAVSSAGAVTKLMQDGAPVSVAAWRLQATSIILLPGFVWELFHLTKEERGRVFSCETASILCASALALALHFGLWVWSLSHTSLPHSLLLVSMPPIILGVVSWLRCKPLSSGENIGIAMGMFGVVTIAAASHVENDAEITFVGDLAAFVAAIAFVVYVTAGSHLRVWMPLFTYSFTVTAAASILLSIACVVVDGNSHPGYISGPFKWLLRKDFWLYNLYLAAGPGFVGHTGFNAVLKYFGAVVISVAITVEPLAGSLIGWALSVSPPPGLSTCIGGVILILGTVWVTYSATNNNTNKSKEVTQHLLDAEEQLQ